MARKVIITCAITGGHADFAKVPDYPVTPEQIARDCIRARAAGAAIVHVHVRDPQTGAHSGETALFAEVVRRVREAGCDVLVNLTTGWGARYVPSEGNPRVGGPGTNLETPERRMAHVLALKPDICTLDVGTLNFGEQIFVGFPPHLRTMARTAQELRVKPELECFELGHIVLAKSLIAQGLIDAPPMFQLCLGIPNAAPATPEVLALMRSMLPPDANWSAFAIGRRCFEMVGQVVAAGGHVRVGLEDNLYMAPGEFATNEKLVARAARIVAEMGAEPATPAEAAATLQLPSR